jgi:hypothetical protein
MSILHRWKVVLGRELLPPHGADGPFNIPPRSGAREDPHRAGQVVDVDVRAWTEEEARRLALTCAHALTEDPRARVTEPGGQLAHAMLGPDPEKAEPGWEFGPWEVVRVERGHRDGAKLVKVFHRGMLLEAARRAEEWGLKRRLLIRPEALEEMLGGGILYPTDVSFIAGEGVDGFRYPHGNIYRCCLRLPVFIDVPEEFYERLPYQEADAGPGQGSGGT